MDEPVVAAARAGAAGHAATARGELHRHGAGDHRPPMAVVVDQAGRAPRAGRCDVYARDHAATHERTRAPASA